MRSRNSKNNAAGRSHLRRASICPPGYYTSAMVRDRLGISETQFRHLARKGVITASKYNAANYALYSEHLLQMLLNRQVDGTLFKVGDEPVGPSREPIVPTVYTAEQGVQVLEMLHEQVPLLQIILKTRLLPQVVRRIQQEYDELVGSVTIPKMILDQMNRLSHLDGSFPLRCASDIFEVMHNASENAAKEHTCTSCDRARSMSICSKCFRTQLEAARASTEDPPIDHPNGSSTLPSGSQPSGSSQNIRQP